MDVDAPAPPDDPSQHDTFCRYLAKQLIAKQGFVVGAPAQAAEIAAQSDYVLTFSDGYSPVIVALIDREANPGKAFALTVERVRAVAEDCRALAGRVGAAKMPVTIQLMEVGGATSDQPARLGEIKSKSFFSKLFVSAWAIDPQRSAIWTTADYRSRGMRKFIQNLLDSPREIVVMPAPVAVAPRSFPWLTTAIIAALAAIFAAEVMFGVGGGDLSKQPTLSTLLAFGGLMGRLVTESGEWYRLFSAPLLHGGVLHIALNAVSIGLAGYVLEPLIGRAWFAALFVIGALTGALLSLALNSDVIVSVGASGAGMALFACMLVLSRRFPKGGMRTQLQMNALYVLVPSLLPLTSAATGAKIDYAAHFGGAIGGVVVGLVLLQLWNASDARPRLRAVGAAIAVAGLAAFLVAGAFVQRSFAFYELTAALVPQSAMPTTDEAARQQSADLVARYPRDPRAHYLHAMTLLRSNDAAGAEKALRATLAEEALWRRAITGGEMADRARGMLALLLLDRGRRDEALEVAKGACGPNAPSQLRSALDKQKLCAN
jgi:rhomboid protease GluP